MNRKKNTLTVTNALEAIDRIADLSALDLHNVHSFFGYSIGLEPLPRSINIKELVCAGS